MRRFWFFVLVVVLLLFLSGCSPRLVVNTEKDPAVKIDLYQSFRVDPSILWKRNDDPVMNNSLQRAGIAQVIAREIENKGYLPQETNANLIFRFEIYPQSKTEERTLYNPYTPWFPYYYRWHWYNFYYYPQTYTRRFNETVVVIEAIDAIKNTLVWQGWTSREINFYEKAYKEKVYGMVKEILSNFPQRTGANLTAPLSMR